MSINSFYHEEEQLDLVVEDTKYTKDVINQQINKIRVVLIEDHELTRIGIRTGLQQKNEIEVVGEAANALEGLRLLENLQPDVAIVDIGLPDKDGIEVTREIKSIAKNQESIKVLILTLRDDQDAVLAAFAAGADSYCMKDSYENLLEAVHVTYEGNAWIDPAIARIVLHQARKNPAKSDITSSDHNNKNNHHRTGKFDAEKKIDLYTLTDRELEVLQLIVEGCSNASIAERLYITIGTVKTHVRNILNKLCTEDRTQAAVLALRSGLAK
jgi:DNA-binding NarL/FixJ family response regulator